MGLHTYGQDPMHGVARIQDVRCEGTGEIRYGETGDWMIRQQLVEVRCQVMTVGHPGCS